MENTTFTTVANLLAEQFDVDVTTITGATNMVEDIEADSLDLFEMLNDVEDAFDVTLTNTESIVTVQNLVDAIEAAK